MVPRRRADAGLSATETCSIDAALASDPAWLLRELVPDPARPRILHREPYRRQISGSIATRQLLSIAPVRLYPITRFNRYKRGCHYLALNAQLRQLPVHDVTCRSRFIAGSHLLC